MNARAIDFYASVIVNAKVMAGAFLLGVMMSPVSSAAMVQPIAASEDLHAIFSMSGVYRYDNKDNISQVLSKNNRLDSSATVTQTVSKQIALVTNDGVNEPYQTTFDDDIDAVVDEDAIEDIDDDAALDADTDSISDDNQGSTDSQTDDTSVSPFDDSNNSSLDIQDIESRDLDSQDLGSPSLGSSNKVSSIVADVPLNAISPNTIQSFVEVIDIIRRDHIKPVNDEVLFEYAIKGMLEKIDRHAEYLSPSNYDKLRSFTDGEIGQVGLSAVYDTEAKAWVVNKVVPKSSAHEAGINVGDQLIRIKQIELTDEMQPQDIDQMLSGIAGTQVQLTMLNAENLKRQVTLQRNLSMNNQLEVMVQEGIAVVRLPIFQNTTKSQLIDALSLLNVPISGMVIDVRNNPGGVLTSALDIASLFVQKEGLIQVKSRNMSKQTIYPTGTPYLADIPVIILQNRYSASAAEVLASSLKSNHRARVVGERSFGKGTVQEVVPLESGGAVKLTVAEYFDIHDNSIDGVGVMPDVTFLHDGSNWQQQAITMLITDDRPLGIRFGNPDEGMSPLNDY